MLPATGRQHRGCIIPQAVIQSSVLEDGQNNCPKHVELTGIINKPLLLHLVGCLYYLYQWCTVKQISDNEIDLLIKYIKSVLWRVAKRLSYTEDARCLQVNEKQAPSWTTSTAAQLHWAKTFHTNFYPHMERKRAALNWHEIGNVSAAIHLHPGPDLRENTQRNSNQQHVLLIATRLSQQRARLPHSKVGHRKLWHLAVSRHIH